MTFAFEPDPFEVCDSEYAVLVALVRAGALRPVGDTVDQAAARLSHLREREARRARTSRKVSGPAEAAIIEVIEPHPPSSRNQGVMKPNELLINGVSILVPRENFLEIEGLEDDFKSIEETGLIVKVRMFARRVVIGERV